MLQKPGLTLEEKLDCFARIAEVSEGIQDCARGFFELGSNRWWRACLPAKKTANFPQTAGPLRG